MEATRQVGLSPRRSICCRILAAPTADGATGLGGEASVTIETPQVAVVERKSLANLAPSLSDGSLAFQMQRLAESGRAAVVIEGDYPDLFRTQPGRGSWLADMLGRLAVRYPEVPIIFAASRKFAEEWASRFLGAAVSDSGPLAEARSSSDEAARSDY
jgi:hypothetical protein